MWPWEHLAVGYVVCSLGFRLGGRRLDRTTVAALAVGTQFPDLVDKPLAWSLGVLPSGVSLAHSVLVAPPLALAVALLARRAGHGAAGAAFAVGYLSHLPADFVYPLLVGAPLAPRAYLWPLVVVHADPSGSVLATVAAFLDRSVRVVSGPRGLVYVAFELAALGVAAALWVVDGAPGLRTRPRATTTSADDG